MWACSAVALWKLGSTVCFRQRAAKQAQQQASNCACVLLYVKLNWSLFPPQSRSWKHHFVWCFWTKSPKKSTYKHIIRLFGWLMASENSTQPQTRFECMFYARSASFSSTLILSTLHCLLITRIWKQFVVRSRAEARSFLTVTEN